MSKKRFCTRKHASYLHTQLHTPSYNCFISYRRSQRHRTSPHSTTVHHFSTLPYVGISVAFALRVRHIVLSCPAWSVLPSGVTFILSFVKIGILVYRRNERLHTRQEANTSSTSRSLTYSHTHARAHTHIR